MLLLHKLEPALGQLTRLGFYGALDVEDFSEADFLWLKEAE